MFSSSLRSTVSLMHQGRLLSNPSMHLSAPPPLRWSCQSIGPQHISSWDAIQSLILNTAELRWCSADKTLSRWGSPDSRTSDIRGLRWTSFLCPLWNSCTHSARTLRLMPDTLSRTHLTVPGSARQPWQEEAEQWTQQDPQVVGTTEILSLLIRSVTSGNSEAKT